jgi:hypothetical protein
MADEWVDVNEWEDVSPQKLQAPPDVASQLKNWGIGSAAVGAGAAGIGYGIK